MVKLPKGQPLPDNIGHGFIGLPFPRDREEQKEFGIGLAKALILLATFYPISGAAGALAKGYQAYKRGRIYQVIRTLKRPITSTITRLGYSSVPETIVTRYGYAKFGVGLLDPLATTRALSRGDYDEAIIGFYGPPGSVNLYRKALESLASSSSPSQQNGGAKGKKTSGKSRSPYSYTPTKSRKIDGTQFYKNCRRGYELKRLNGKLKCVKK